MKKLNVSLVQNEDGKIGMVINHTKKKDYVHVVGIENDKLSPVTYSWRTDTVTPWSGNLFISNPEKLIL